MRNCLIILIMMTLFSGAMKSQQVIDLLPGNPEGWNARGEDKIYTPETLYDYIDGGAELYLSYDMKEVASRIIENGANEIRIEIFDMVEAKNAFGVFTHTRTSDEHIYGQGSQKFTGALIFWKDKFFIAITANDENEIIKTAITKIASDIDGKITTTGILPAILDLLPRQDLDTSGLVYFHHYIWLNSFYYISGDNLLSINSDTDAILAKYGKKESRSFLLILDYNDPEKAAENVTNFRKEFFDGENTAAFQKLEDSSWVGITAKENYLIAVFNAPDEGYASGLIKATITNIIKP